MGLRHRSIRLRVGILIAVPVLCLLTLYGFVAAFTLGSTLTQLHAKTVKDELGVPVSNFQKQLGTERMLALLSLANPTSTTDAGAFEKQEVNTDNSFGALVRAVREPSVTSYASPADEAAIHTLLKQFKSQNFADLRGDVVADAISLGTALAGYDSVINTGFTVINQAIYQQTNVGLVTQALNVIDLDRASQAGQEELDLLVADMSRGSFPESDRLIFAGLSANRQQLISASVPQLTAPYHGYLATYVMTPMANAMNRAESAVASTPWRHGVPPAPVLAARGTIIGYSTALGKALTLAADRLEQQANTNANKALLELILAAGLGLLGAIVSIALSLLIGRSLIRQLRGLRGSAISLAEEKLPAIMTRLRAGEPVDVREYTAKPVSTSDEIELVQQAFSVVQEAAVQSAVDEARLRRGISDVFRNLAGRSQSLLHRQLTLLDGMERRATEPDELEDLFRLDHLTTRMRRHAEGLIILSGETPSRGWRQPVPLVDVLRAAVAEVEDYTRIRVLSRTNAAVAGHAVADVIHLVAELAENATVFSPPNTPVRIQGDVVGRGFAIEIEDRGLGISATRLDEINENLANPPQFDLSGSDRLGLFIAGQLAQRHNIKVSLRPSVYGGTTAVVLLPTSLVVDADTFERDPALTAGADNGTRAEVVAGSFTFTSAARQSALTQQALTQQALTQQALSQQALSQPALTQSALTQSSPTRPAARSNGLALPGGDPQPPRPRRGFTLTGRTVPRETAVPPATESPTGADARSASPDPFSAGPAARPAGSGPVVAGSPPWPPSPPPRHAEPEPVANSSSAGAGTDSEVRTPTGGVTETGLPVRIRQASLAPQLRNSPPPGPVAADPPAWSASGGAGWSGLGTGGSGAAGSGAGRPGVSRPGAGDYGTGGVSYPSAPDWPSPAGSGPEPAGDAPATQTPSTTDPASAGGPVPASPEAARNTMSALQRGWQLGRSEASDPSESVFTPRRPASPLPKRIKDSPAPPPDTESAPDAEPGHE